MDKNVLIVACHTNTGLKKNSLLSNIYYFSELCSHMVIINSVEYQDDQFEMEIKSKRINEQCNIVFEYTQNDKYICHGKWLHYLKKTDMSEYDNIILANDSFLVTKSLNEYKALIHPDIELVALLESYETKHHYPDFLRTYNQKGLTKIITFYEQNMLRIHNYFDCIMIYEIESSSLFDNVKTLFIQDPNVKLNIHFENKYLEHNLCHLNYPLVKLKKLEYNYYDHKELPHDFDPLIYQSLHPDLGHFNHSQLTQHFIGCGMNEGRLYKKNQSNKLPLFLEKYLFHFFYTKLIS
jgi:hypothetical protein